MNISKMNIENIIQKPIIFLNCDNDLISLFAFNNISIIKDVWVLQRKDLIKMGFNSAQINQIIIKLQLIGLDLNKKKYAI